jgi:DNA polymerase-3 subunit delta'
MNWQDYIGGERQKNWFSNAIRTGRLASTFLLVGPEGVGKRTFSKLMAKTLFCRQRDPAELDPCGVCEQCVQIDAETHPDLLEVSRPPGKATLPLEILIGERDVRMQEGLLYELSRKPFHGNRRIAIINDADFLADTGANALLKTLEEPAPGAILFLLSTSRQRQLPTIRSRCQVVNFPPLSADEQRQLILRNNDAISIQEVDSALQIARGRQIAVDQLQDPEFKQTRDALFASFAARPLPIGKIIRLTLDSVNSVGKDGAPRRARLKAILDLTIDFHRAIVHDADGSHAADLPAVLQSSMAQMKEPVAASNRVIARTLEAMQQVDRNIAAAAIVEAWVTNIATARSS